MTKLTHSRLLEILSYDSKTGLFTWRRRKIRKPIREKASDIGWNVRFADKPAGCPGRHGHHYITILGKHHCAHRLAWFYVYGEWPSEDLDHKNGIPNDNRIENLREATDVQNLRNQKIRVDNSSGVKGVSWSKKEQKWYAYININGKMIGLGRFHDLTEATKIRHEAEREHFGEFSRLNL